MPGVRGAASAPPGVQKRGSSKLAWSLAHPFGELLCWGSQKRSRPVCLRVFIRKEGCVSGTEGKGPTSAHGGNLHRASAELSGWCLQDGVCQRAGEGRPKSRAAGPRVGGVLRGSGLPSWAGVHAEGSHIKHIFQPGRRPHWFGPHTPARGQERPRVLGGDLGKQGSSGLCKSVGRWWGWPTGGIAPWGGTCGPDRAFLPRGLGGGGDGNTASRCGQFLMKS